MKSYDILGIGAGPANLSLAALVTKLKNINAVFIEKRKEFVWHAGMLLPGAKLQVPFLNDLVTLADPTNPYSFLNFLSVNKRLYQFIAANFNPMVRTEFNQYFQWVFDQLENIQKEEEVVQVALDEQSLIITTTKDKYRTRNLVLGTGQVPYIPQMFQSHINTNVYHNSHFLHQKDSYSKKRIAVIGGGQSGAEIVHSLISEDKYLPSEVFWVSRRSNFSPLDDTPFTNEVFTPHFIRYFHELDDSKRQYLLKEHKLANQGISECTAKEIYQRLYELRFIKKGEEKFYLLPSHELVSIKENNGEYEIEIQDMITGSRKSITADKVILCTGYRYQLPGAMSEIEPLLDYDDRGLCIDVNYKLQWRGSDIASIYVQNGAEHTHGISDSTLSTSAYRSATILNDIVGNKVYPNIEDSSLIDWGWNSDFKSDC
jgi:lysine N6-hydroxylase